MNVRTHPEHWCTWGIFSTVMYSLHKLVTIFQEYNNARTVLIKAPSPRVKRQLRTLIMLEGTPAGRRRSWVPMPTGKIILLYQGYLPFFDSRDCTVQEVVTPIYAVVTAKTRVQDILIVIIAA